MKVTNKNVINEITSKYDFRFKKDLGQNFLTDENIVLKIVDALELKEEGRNIIIHISQFLELHFS